jgi:hypothetical protein
MKNGRVPNVKEFQKSFPSVYDIGAAFQLLRQAALPKNCRTTLKNKKNRLKMRRFKFMLTYFISLLLQYEVNYFHLACCTQIQHVHTVCQRVA